VGLLALTTAFVVGGTREERRLEGSNGIGPSQFVVNLKPRQVVCQRAARLPAGIGSVGLTIGTYGKAGPLLRISVKTAAGGPALPAGRLAPGWIEGPIDLPLGGNTRRRLSDARICIANRGGVRIAIAGTDVADAGARVGGRATHSRLSLNYRRARPESPWDLAPRITRRMTVGTGLWGSLAPWAAIALVLLTAGAAVRAILAGVRGS
jgi:hypothetical protein